MKSFLFSTLLLLLLTSTCEAQIKNGRTETVKISGNCGMCESTIEKSGSAKNEAQVDWDRDTKTASITYNPDKTTKDEILKRVALAGYDNEAYLAPDEAYHHLSGCCQYDRTMKNSSASADNTLPATNEMAAVHQNHPVETTAVSAIVATTLQPVYDAYFALKDALVKTDGADAAVKGSSLFTSLKAVDMSKLTNEEHTQWMKSQSALIADAQKISATKEVVQQRESFITLSANMYLLMKTSTREAPVYFQHCPMANDGQGADWLSKESGVKNPYYGSRMLTCGKTVETLQ